MGFFVGEKKRRFCRRKRPVKDFRFRQRVQRAAGGAVLMIESCRSDSPVRLWGSRENKIQSIP